VGTYSLEDRFSSGYWQIPVNPDDSHKTAFATDEGLFDSHVVPSVLSNAPAVFNEQ